MSDEEISGALSAMWRAAGTEEVDIRDKLIFELYRQRKTLREALERIAEYPYQGRSQQIAEKALASAKQPPVEVTAQPSKVVEAAVNRGLAATVLRGLPAGIELMRKEGVPPQVIKRVLLHPQSRRATDWLRPQDVLSVHVDRDPRPAFPRLDSAAPRNAGTVETDARQRDAVAA